MVVALHLGGVPKIGAYAVFGFYILSGYLMTLVMQTTYGYNLSGIGKYAANRFLRIYPVYWVSLLLSVALIICLGNQYTSAYHASIYLPVDLNETLRNLLLFFPFRENPRLIPPAWALTVEIFFYIIIGLGVSRSKRITLHWFIVSAVYHLFVVVFQFGWEARYFTIFAASLPFSSGSIIFHYKEEITRLVSRLDGILYNSLPCMLLIFILLNWYLGFISRNLEGWFFYSNFILCSAMVGVLLSRSNLPFINRKLDRLIGDFSYPIYLIHYQVGIIVIVLFSAFDIQLHRPGLLLLFISILPILIMSWLVTVTVERPIEIIRIKVKKLGSSSVIPDMVASTEIVSSQDG